MAARHLTSNKNKYNKNNDDNNSNKADRSLLTARWFASHLSSLISHLSFSSLISRQIVLLVVGVVVVVYAVTGRLLSVSQNEATTDKYKDSLKHFFYAYLENELNRATLQAKREKHKSPINRRANV